MTNGLGTALKRALQLKLLTMADDELILAHRNSEWTGHGPILEEDIAFSNIAQDELGHASIWYELLGELSGDEADRLVFFRNAAAFRNAQMVELPIGDWAFSMMRQYLFDVFEMVRLAELARSAYRPLAEAAAKIRPEEIYHYRHTSSWIKRLGLGTDESNLRTQAALVDLWPLAFQLFLPLDAEDQLVKAGLVPDPRELRQAWEESAMPFLRNSGLQIPDDVVPLEQGRDAHTGHMEDLLAELQEVARLDPEAAW